jgi:WD40 repeat protein
MRYLRVRFCIILTGLVGLLLWPNLLNAQQEIAELKVFKKHNGPVKALAFSADSKILATGGDDKQICFWNLESGEVLGTIQQSFSVKALQFTPDGNILAACGNDVKLMDMQGKLIRTFSGYTTDIWSFSYSNISQQLVAGSYAKSIRIWDFLTGKPFMLLEGHERSALPVCFSPSGNLIASGSLDKSVRLWDAATGNEKYIMELHTENIFAVAFHPSGKYLVSASADKTLRLWSADSGRIVRTFIGHPGAVFDVQFSPDGNHLLSCDAQKTIILWETATGKKLHVFTGHTGAVNAIKFCNDGSAFASASDDQTVRIWPLDMKFYISGSYFEKEIEESVSSSPLFTPRGEEESRQDYALREAEANKYLDSLYEKYYRKYIEMLNKLPIEGKENEKN